MHSAPAIELLGLPEDDIVQRAVQNRPLQVRSFGLTDQGLLRPGNEDQFLIAELAKTLQVQQCSLPSQPSRQAPDRGYLFMVADGMGGHRAGEKASALAVDAIESFLVDSLKSLFQVHSAEQQQVLTGFREALHWADQQVYAKGTRHPELHGMGTTVTLACFLAPNLFIAHVGDSRCYIVRSGKLYQVTCDHTLTQDMIRKGCLSPADAVGHQFRHVITNVVGGREAGVDVETHQIRIEPGDGMLLCSDGLTEMVTDEQILRILQETDDPQTACRRLASAANEAGGKDNITVVVARFVHMGGDEETRRGLR